MARGYYAEQNRLRAEKQASWEDKQEREEEERRERNARSTWQKIEDLVVEDDLKSLHHALAEQAGLE